MQHEEEEIKRKRQLLESLERARRAAPPEKTEHAAGGEMAALREKLRIAQATCAMLEQEIERLEQKALQAIAEAGELRRRLNLLQNTSPADALAALTERETLRQHLGEVEQERALLTRALHASEREIARLTQCMDIVVRKLKIAM
ncbi:MAG: hypothetical protein N3A66_03100 [Planctomycetota bacterium]|nr:hypothetical protein [Planctomycetota bacterium]